MYKSKLNQKGSTQVILIAVLVLGVLAAVLYYTMQNKDAEEMTLTTEEDLMETTVQLEEPEGTPEEISNEELETTDQMLEEIDLDTTTSVEIDNL